MSSSRNYDTVAFDVRDNATMLFFAKTTDTGDIGEYLLLMRAEGDDYDQAVYIEVNEQLYSGHDKIKEARLAGNMLTLELKEPAAELDGASQIVLTYDETAENQASVEAGVIRVLGATLAGGNA